MTDHFHRSGVRELQRNVSHSGRTCQKIMSVLRSSERTTMAGDEEEALPENTKIYTTQGSVWKEILSAFCEMIHNPEAITDKPDQFFLGCPDLWKNAAK